MKAIASARISFQIPSEDPGASGVSGQNVTLLLGDNGTGKTTILSSIALAILSRVLEGSGFRPYHLVRHGQDEAFSIAELVLGSDDYDLEAKESIRALSHLRLRIRGDFASLDADSLPEGEAPNAEPGHRESIWERLYEDSGNGFLLLGYGSTRRIERSESFDPSGQDKRRSRRYQRVASLFEDHLALVPIAGWLPIVDAQRQQEIVALINDALPDEITFNGDQDEARQYLFEQDGIGIPFGALSDGYRIYIGLIADIIYHINTACDSDQNLFNCEGIVLVDEIGLHLHPDWQRLVLGKLSNVLPRIQFIVTSHSPIIAGTVRSKNLVILERNEDGSVTARRSKESIYGRSADEILLSGHFGLKTTRAEGASMHLQKLARDAMDGNTEAAIKYMELLAPAEGEPAFEAEPITEAIGLDHVKREHRERRRRFEWRWYPYGALVVGFLAGASTALLVWWLI